MQGGICAELASAPMLNDVLAACRLGSDRHPAGHREVRGHRPAVCRQPRGQPAAGEIKHVWSIIARFQLCMLLDACTRHSSRTMSDIQGILDVQELADAMDAGDA